MDLKVKSLLDDINISPGNEKKNSKILNQTFKIFQEIDDSQFSGDIPESVSMDMYIKCAELAISNGDFEIAEQTIHLYFTKAPPTDPQKCNAYMCQAKLSAPKSNMDVQNLKESGENIERAIRTALKNPLLTGKIYEASTLYWKFCYQFLRPGYHSYVANTLAKIVYALTEIQDNNVDWRAFLSITLIECYIESKQKASAVAAVTTIAPFVKQSVPSQYKRLFQLMIFHQLADPQTIQSEADASLELSVLFGMCQIKQKFESNDCKENPQKEILNLMTILDIAIPSKYIEKSPPTVRETKSGKRESLKRPKSPSFKVKKVKLSRNESRHIFILEMSRLCLKLGFYELAQLCLESVKSNLLDNSLNIQLEFINCELVVHSHGRKQMCYRKKSVEIRLSSIKHCEDNIIKAIRQNDKASIQFGCVTLWNLSLPLLMWNLRSNLRKPLILVAQALEDIQCLFMQVRCQVHLELAQCEEEIDHIRSAIEHLHKAMVLDDSGVYTEKIRRKLHRLTLRSELYKQPERKEDIAAMIIEQASTASNTGSGEMKKSLLMKAGIALAPYTFHLVLDSEKLFHDTHIKLMPRNSIQLAKCVHHYNANIHKSDNHIRLIEDKNDIERFHIWVDLVKIARKQEVWDICRTATQFCLLYDDERWQALKPKDTSKVHSSESVGAMGKTEEPAEKSSNVEMEKSSLAERERLRMLAEISFIRGEALMHLLRKENVELNNEPVFPTDMSKRPKSYLSTLPAEDRNWNIYTEWVSQLNAKITSCFLRGLEHGTNLQETWLVGNAAVYFWNYSTHIIRQSRYPEITETLNSILEGFKKTGYKGFEPLLINICTALAYAFITPWMPAPIEEIESVVSSPAKGKASASKLTRKSSSIIISQMATPYLKKSIEVCEFAMEVLNDKKAKKLISQSAKMSLLKVWVISKQMAQQQIGKIWSKNEDSSTVDDDKFITQIIVYLEMHSLNRNRVMEFKDLPSLSDIVGIMEKCSWNDNLVKLQLLTSLVYLLFNQKMFDRIIHVAQPVTTSFLEILSSNETALNPSECEKVSHLFLVMGQSLHESNGHQSLFQSNAMECFLHSAKFGCMGVNYELVISAAHHFWNTVFPILKIRSQRRNLRNSLEKILSSISEVLSKHHAAQAKKQTLIKTPSQIKEPRLTIYGPIGNFISNEVILDKKEDMNLRVSLYNLLFQCYSEQDEWEKGLKVLDTAISELPSTHRMEMFRQRVLTKSRLGINMSLDFQKFKGEKENVISSLWRDIALNSQQLVDQLEAYQKSIEILVSDEYKWQKVDYLIEFGQWLYMHQFPIQDVHDTMEWALDILMGMQFELPFPDSPETMTKSDGQKTEGKAKDEKPLYKLSQSEGTEENDFTNTINLIPKEREILIGAQLLSSNLNVTNLFSIKQLDYLIQCHVLLSDIYNPSSGFFYKYSLLAYDFVIRLWNLSFTNASQFMHELSSKETPVPTKDTKAKGKGQKPKKEKGRDGSETPSKDKEKDKHKEKAKKSNILSLPQSPREWATFEFSEELLELFKLESAKSCSINKTCFEHAWLSLHYLMKLVKNLRKIDLHHFALPVIVLYRAIATLVLESKSLILLAHCMTMKLCCELNMKSGVTLHETAVTRALQNEMPDILQMHESAERYKHNVKTTNSPKDSSSLSESENKKLGEAKAHLGVDLRNGVIYNIWTEIAGYLIEQTRYQSARQFLTVAYKFADCFQDEICKVKISYLIAKLAFVEAQYKTAFHFCLEIQKNYCTNEYYWYKTVLLLCKVVTQKSFMNDYQFAQNIFENAIKELERSCASRLNQAMRLRLYIIKLKTKLIETKVKSFFQTFDQLSEEAVEEYLVTIKSEFQTIRTFLQQNNLKRRAIIVMESQAKIWHKVALKSPKNQDLQQKYYVECIDLMRMAIFEAKGIVYNIVAITPIDWQIYFPMKRKMAELRLDCSTILIEIKAIQFEDEIIERKVNENKNPIVKTVEELAASTPVFFSYQKKWMESRCWIADVILSQATTVQHATKLFPKYCSRALLNIAHCLLKIASWPHFSVPKTWSLAEMGFIQTGTENDQLSRENAQRSDEQQNIPFSESSYISSKNKRILKWHKSSMSFLFQSSECFLQSLELALENRLYDVSMSACLGLINLVGQYDNPICTQFLALYQSCSAAIYLQNLLEASQLNPRKNRLAALLHQRKHLLNKELNNFSCMNLFSYLSNSLQTEWQASKRCQVFANHFSFQKEFPANFYFVILQHSDDGNFLYASFMDKNKSTKSAANSKQQSGASSSPQSSVQRAANFGCAVNKQDLLQLLEMAKEYKNEAKSNYIKRSIQVNHQTQCLNMYEGLRCCMEDSTGELIFEPIIDVKSLMQEAFLNLVKSMESYLAPVLEPLVTFLQTIIPTNPYPPNAKDQREFLVILADASLLELPLESLCYFRQFIEVVSISRDISLQMLYHRIQPEPVPEEPKDGKKKEKKPPEPPSRLNPTGSKAPAKKGKGNVLDRTLPPWAQPINTASFKYIVDPFNECYEDSSYNPVQTFKKVSLQYEQFFTSQWMGLYGSNHAVSPGEWEVYLNNCGSFIFYGPGKLTTFLNPSKLSAFNLSKCLLLFQLDLNENYSSFERQSFLNESNKNLFLENPLQIAMLLSLAGVRCIMGNQWVSTLEENANHLQNSMKCLLQEGLSTGETSHQIQTPYLKREKPEEIVEEMKKSPSGIKKKKPKKGEKTMKPVEIHEISSSRSIIHEKAFSLLSLTDLHQEWFNMVCYGLPNLIVTQIN